MGEHVVDELLKFARRMFHFGGTLALGLLQVLRKSFQVRHDDGYIRC